MQEVAGGNWFLGVQPRSSRRTSQDEPRQQETALLAELEVLCFYKNNHQQHPPQGESGWESPLSAEKPSGPPMKVKLFTRLLCGHGWGARRCIRSGRIWAFQEGVNNIDLNHSGSVEISETCIHSGGPLYGCCCLNLFFFWGGCLLETECAASHLQRKTALFVDPVRPTPD